MKIAISGKGRVGKTVLAAMLSEIFAESGYSVITIDADPDTNPAATPGFIPDDQAPVNADLASFPIFNSSRQIMAAVKDTYRALLSLMGITKLAIK